MNKLFNRRMVAWAMTLCLLVGCVSFANASQTQTPDFDVLKPLMDLVACAAISAGEEPESVGNEETTMTTAFIASFFNCGQNADASLGITADMLTNTDAQSAYLGKVFAAKLPALTAITQTAPGSDYIGFQPVYPHDTDNGAGDVQIIGELYRASKPMSQMSDAEYKDIQWLDRAVYSFRADATAMNGYRLTGFSVGSELNMEEAMQTYTEKILVEYFNTTLGFSILYPSVFTDDMLVEDGDGVSAKLPDDSVSFFVKRTENATAANLADYINVIAQGIPGAKATLNEAFSYATVAYDTQEGYAVFDMYIITDKYIYQAELSYKQGLASTYQMYTAYLENSFAVDEVSVG